MIKLYGNDGVCSIDVNLPQPSHIIEEEIQEDGSHRQMYETQKWNDIVLNKVPIGKITNLYSVRDTLMSGETDEWKLENGYIENIDFGNHDEFDDCLDITLKFDKIRKK